MADEDAKPRNAPRTDKSRSTPPAVEAQSDGARTRAERIELLVATLITEHFTVSSDFYDEKALDWAYEQARRIVDYVEQRELAGAR